MGMVSDADIHIGHTALIALPFPLIVNRRLEFYSVRKGLYEPRVSEQGEPLR